MDEVDIFREAVADYGGRLDAASLEPATASGFDYVAQRARGFLRKAATALPEMPPIHFDFFDSWQFNAAAFRCHERYFIGVCRGAVATLAVLFDRMLADPEVLPFIGHAEGERVGLPLLPALGTDFERTVASVPTFPRPRYSVRRSTARTLTELALDFLTAHEFAHIANGHVDYAEEVLGIRAIDEVGRAARTPGTKKRALISQTMEMDADATAVVISLGSEWGRVVGTVPRPGPEWDWFYDRPGMVSLQWSWAISSLFRIFGEARFTDKDVLKSHPPPRLRSVMVRRAAGQVLRPQELGVHPALAGDEFYKIPLSITAAQLDVEKIFSGLTGKLEISEGLGEAWGDFGESLMHRLYDYWRTKLKGDLLDFAYQPLDGYGEYGEAAGRP
jgi:hypothetical protein